MITSKTWLRQVIGFRSLISILVEPGLPSDWKTALCRQILGCVWVVESARSGHSSFSLLPGPVVLGTWPVSVFAVLLPQSTVTRTILTSWILGDRLEPLLVKCLIHSRLFLIRAKSLALFYLAAGPGPAA